MLALGRSDHRLSADALTQLRELTAELEGFCEPDAVNEYRRFLDLRQRRLDLDRAALTKQLKGATVLVTGGTGCIGSVLLRELRAFAPRRIVSVSRGMRTGSPMYDEVEYLRLDLRDDVAVHRVLADVRPTIIYHLAAQHDPGLAEHLPNETISTNVFGTRNLLEAAASVGVKTFVHASTGKTLRPFTPDVYAGSKKLAEWLVAQSAERTKMACASVRFTHVVDNSIIGQRIADWVAEDLPIRLHGPEIYFYLQSALESADLVMNAGLSAKVGTLTMQAIRDLGCPASLTDLALGAIAIDGNRGAIHFCGFESGYEETPYPCLYDPMLSGGLSPLVNGIEAARTHPSATCPAVDEFPLRIASTPYLGAGVAMLEATCCDGSSDEALKAELESVSWHLLDAYLEGVPIADLERAARRALRDPSVAGSLPIHRHTHDAIISVARARGVDITPPWEPTIRPLETQAASR